MKKTYDSENHVTAAWKTDKTRQDFSNANIIHGIHEITKVNLIISREIKIPDATIRRIIAENIRYRSYVLYNSARKAPKKSKEIVNKIEKCQRETTFDFSDEEFSAGSENKQEKQYMVM